MVLVALTAVAISSQLPTVSTNPAVFKLSHLIEEIARVKHAPHRWALKGKVITIRQEELNAYLSVLIAQKGKGQIKSVQVNLEGERVLTIKAVGRIEWSKVLQAEEDSLTAKWLKKVGGMDNNVEINLQTASAKGKGYVKILAARIDGLTLPQALVSEVLESIGKKQKPPLDFSGLIALPYGIQKIVVQKDSLLLYF